MICDQSRMDESQVEIASDERPVLRSLTLNLSRKTKQ